MARRKTMFPGYPNLAKETYEQRKRGLVKSDENMFVHHYVSTKHPRYESTGGEFRYPKENTDEVSIEFDISSILLAPCCDYSPENKGAMMIVVGSDE